MTEEPRSTEESEEGYVLPDHEEAAEALRVLHEHVEELRSFRSGAPQREVLGSDWLERWGKRVAADIAKLVGPQEAATFRRKLPEFSRLEAKLSRVATLENQCIRALVGVIDELRSHPEAVFEREGKTTVKPAVPKAEAALDAIHLQLKELGDVGKSRDFLGAYAGREALRRWKESAARMLEEHLGAKEAANIRSITAGVTGRTEEESFSIEYGKAQVFLTTLAAHLGKHPELVSAQTGERAPRGREIFLVHGQDHRRLQEVRDFVASLTRRSPVILHEKPDQSQTIIQKLEREAGKAGFAIVLLTGDDEGRSREGKELQPRARRNVILELGLFFGLLGRECVCLLYEEGVELPSDVHGILHKPLGGNWRAALASELEAAGFEVDRSTAPTT